MPTVDRPVMTLKPPVLRYMAHSGLLAGGILWIIFFIRLCFAMTYSAPPWPRLLLWVVIFWLGLMALYPFTAIKLTFDAVNGAGDGWGFSNRITLPLNVIDVQASYDHSQRKAFIHPYLIQSATSSDKVALFSAFSRKQFDELLDYIRERQRELGVEQLYRAKGEAGL